MSVRQERRRVNTFLNTFKNAGLFFSAAENPQHLLAEAAWFTHRTHIDV
jgi:hypothetical protein